MQKPSSLEANTSVVTNAVWKKWGHFKRVLAIEILVWSFGITGPQRQSGRILKEAKGLLVSMLAMKLPKKWFENRISIDNVYKGLRLESFAAWRTSYGNGDEILTAMRRSNTESRMLMDWLSLLIYLAILLYIAITNWYLFILYLIIGWVGKTACVFTVWHCGCDLWIRFENSTHGWFSPQEHQTSFVIRFLPNFGRRWWEISSPFLFHWQSFYDAFG